MPSGDTVVIHSPTAILHYTSPPDEYGTLSGDSRPKVVRRGTQQIGETITIGEPAKIDHVIFVVHGIGVTCDMRYRNIIECGE